MSNTMNYNPTVDELQSMTLAELMIVACKQAGGDELLQKLFDMAEKHRGQFPPTTGLSEANPVGRIVGGANRKKSNG